LTTVAKCETCCGWFLQWKQQVATGLDLVPKFSTFI
jgi:hypothetical protein